MSIADVVASIESMQPVLLRLDGAYFVKVDKEVIPVTSDSCFCEFLVQIHYVFNVQYEHKLKLTFGFLEKLMKITLSTFFPVRVLHTNSKACSQSTMSWNRKRPS